MPSIQFISDLHLSEDKPHLLALFKHFMQTIAPQSPQLFVLGDLFDVWLGDDDQSEFNQTVIDYFADYANNHGELFIGHGNRDFLIGERFTQACGAKLIDEPYSITWHNKNIDLMHGDSLCSDDVAYQEFKAMVRTEKWQAEFLALPLEQRQQIAGGIKQESKAAQKQKSMQIMDVNQSTVIEYFKQSQTDWLIHGHTHRENCHNLSINNKDVKRIVLADWDQQGHYLKLDSGKIDSIYFDLPA
jgi:UDP-2,3-diacylglucosamine hydrolase